MDHYDWKDAPSFLNRTKDLEAMERWWEHSTQDALGVIGRRRVGKSWLFRRFAHGRPTIVLVADRLLKSTQMARFAKDLEPHFGVRPVIPDVPTLIRYLYQLGREQKILAIIDEFPFLIPEGKDGEEMLSAVQAVMEDRDGSQTKLLLCGSVVGQMEHLMAESSPLHGRIRPLNVWPMTLAEGRALCDPGDAPDERIIRFAVAGGMARYLADLGHGPIRDAVCSSVLDRRAPLFNDPRDVLEQELRRPATYFSILEELAGNPAQTEHLTKLFGLDSKKLSPYLKTLREMRLVHSYLPVGAPDTARNTKHRVTDGFTRFWFRFVFPYQDNLEEGLPPKDLWNGTIEPMLADFVAPTFEELCVRYTRVTKGTAVNKVGSWWGPSLNVHRKDGSRQTEEVDVVGAHHKRLKIVGECKWISSPMPLSVLDDLRTFKIPAIAQEKNLKVSADGPEILLFARSGFTPDLGAAAAADDKIQLIDLDEILSALDGE